MTTLIFIIVSRSHVFLLVVVVRALVAGVVTAACRGSCCGIIRRGGAPVDRARSVHQQAPLSGFLIIFGFSTPTHDRPSFRTGAR